MLFSSHQLDLVEGLCERAIIVDRGAEVADGPMADLTLGNDPVLVIDVPSDPDGTWTGELDRQRFGVLGVVHGTARLSVHDADTNAAALGVAQEALTALRGAVNRFGFERRTLAEVFMSLVAAPPTSTPPPPPPPQPPPPRRAADECQPDRVPVALVARREVSEAFRQVHQDPAGRVGDRDRRGDRDRQPGERGGKDKVTLGMVGTLSAEQTASAADLGAAIGAEPRSCRWPTTPRRIRRRCRRRRRGGTRRGHRAADRHAARRRRHLRAVLVNVLRRPGAHQRLAAAGLDAAQIEAVRTSPPPAIETVHPADDDEADGARLGTALTISICCS